MVSIVRGINNSGILFRKNSQSKYKKQRRENESNLNYKKKTTMGNAYCRKYNLLKQINAFRSVVIR